MQKQKVDWYNIIHGNVLMMGVVSLFTDLSSEMVYPLLPVFFTGLVPLGTAAIYIGLMEGLAESAASLFKIISGRFSDALGKRKALVVIGYGISIVCRPLMSLSSAGWHVITLRFCDRVGKGIRTSPRDALISDSVKHNERGLAFSFHRAMDHSGAILGSLLAVAILYALCGYSLWRGSTARATSQEMFALRWLFGIALVPGLVAMGALIGKVREIAPKHHPQIDGKTDQTSTKVERLPKKFYYFLGIVTLFALGNSSDLFLVFYSKTKFQFNLLQVIGIWVALHVSKIAFSFPGGILSDRLGRRPVIVTGWLVYALVYLGLAIVTQEWALWVLIIAYGFYYGMTEGVEKALVSDLVLSKYRGRAYGLYHGAVGLAALPASLLFGVFWNILGPKPAFGIGAALAGVATVLLFILLSTGEICCS
jgi:MFS family permease